MHGPWFKDLIDLIACPTLHSKFAGLVVGPEISNGRQSLLLSGSSSAKVWVQGRDTLAIKSCNLSKGADKYKITVWTQEGTL